jgi:hypothetical protein
MVLAGDERRTLENWVRRRSTAQGLALRARIVLACAQGGSTATNTPGKPIRPAGYRGRCPYALDLTLTCPAVG